MRILTLNLNHRTHPKKVSEELLEVVFSEGANVVVLTEFVQGESSAVTDCFQREGFEVTVSSAIKRKNGGWCNQVLIATNKQLDKEYTQPSSARTNSAKTNFLKVTIDGISITGLRVPYYATRNEWIRYWQWLSTELSGDLIIGDLNVDPERNNPKDRIGLQALDRAGWKIETPVSGFSYRGHTGKTSKIDHLAHRGNVSINDIRYVSNPFETQFSDHAALIVDFEIIGHERIADSGQ